MRTFLTALIALLLPATAFAIPTAEHPLLYKDEIVACDPRFFGLWIKPDGEEDIIIEQIGEKLYSVQMLSWTWSPTFHSHCGMIEGRGELFAEFYEEGAGTIPNFEREPRIIAIMALTDEGKLEIRVLNDDWLYRMSEAGELDISHEASKRFPAEHVHITASTEELRAFLLQQLQQLDAGNPEAFKTYLRHRKLE